MAEHSVSVTMTLKYVHFVLSVCQSCAPSDEGGCVRVGSGSAPVNLEIDSEVPPASFASPVSSVLLPEACGPTPASV